METRIEVRPDHKIAAIRHIGPYYEIGAAFGRLGEWVKGSGTPWGEMVGVFYDDPRVVPIGELRSDAAMTVVEGTAVGGEVEVRELPGGRFFTATHMGPYSGLPNAWGEFVQKFIASGFKRREAPTFEVYVQPMGMVPDEEVRTDLFIPIE